tara:strand:- start:1006 stop:1161 length:156 start_codon:yes stop_codon:yes gene_type:complete
MTKKDLIEAAKNKQKLNKARKIYRALRAENPMVDELQKRFGLLPILEEIDV